MSCFSFYRVMCHMWPILMLLSIYLCLRNGEDTLITLIQERLAPLSSTSYFRRSLELWLFEVRVYDICIYIYTYLYIDKKNVQFQMRDKRIFPSEMRFICENKCACSERVRIHIYTHITLIFSCRWFITDSIIYIYIFLSSRRSCSYPANVPIPLYI